MSQHLTGYDRIRRRSLLQFGAGGLGATAISAAALPLLGRGGLDVHAQEETPANPLETRPHEGHASGMTVGDVDVARMGFDPSVRVSAFDYGEAATMADGSVGCEREITAFDQERAGEPASNWITFSGAAAGVALMYLTALLVAA